MFDHLFNSPFLYSLSLTLLHFLWQGLLVALILKSLLSIVASNKSKIRYSLATLAMLANAILATLTFIMVYPDTTSGINSNLSPIPLTSLVSELTQQNPLLNYQELLPSILAYFLPYLSLLWLLSIAILASKLLIEIRNVNILPMRSSVAPSPELLARFSQLVRQIQLTKTPQLLISLKAEVPMAIGWLKPVVLLPMAMVTNLNSVQLEMLILHELAHIRRHDYLVNFLQTLIELVFFFHPGVHWVGKIMRNEREYCSDDIAVQHCGDAIAYAHTLTDTASLCSKKHCQTIPQMAMAASGGDLKARIIRLVDHHCAPTNYMSKWLAASSLLITLSLLSLNQMLAMPFAQQVNNQFPWQEQETSTQPDIANIASLLTGNDNINTIAQINSIAQDSIAQQLVSDNLVNVTKTRANQSENALTRKLVSSDKEEFEFHNKVTVLAIDKIDTFSIDASTSTKDISAINISKLDKNVKVPSLKKNQVKPVSVNQNHDKTVSYQPEMKSKEINAITKPLLLKQPIDKLTVKNKSLMSKSLPINVTYTTLKNNIVVEPLITEKMSKKSPYHPLSYTNEINLLSRKNKTYQTTSPVVNQMTPSLQKGDIDPLKKEVLDVYNSIDAKLLNSVSPVYPYLAKRRGIEMVVKVNFIIDKDGRVTNIKFDQQRKLNYFKPAIRSAMRKWRFSPATINNNKVESNMTKIFSFSLYT
jgi:TonB family protein